MKLFKGFYPDMTCRGFQFKEGETYSEPEAKLCKSGFHACINPLDVFMYYTPEESIYREVDMDPIVSKETVDTKVCSKNVTIGKRISVKDFIDKAINYLKSHKLNDQYTIKRFPYEDAYSGDSSVSITTQNSERAIAGNQSIAKAENFGTAISGRESISIAGYSGLAICKFHGKAISGIYGTSISNYGSCLTGKLGTAIGDRYVKAGDCSIVILNSIGHAVVKAGINSVIMYKTESGPVSFKIDGEKYKPNVWYEVGIQFNGENTEYELVEANKIDSAKAEAYFEGE